MAQQPGATLKVTCGHLPFLLHHLYEEFQMAAARPPPELYSIVETA